MKMHIKMMTPIAAPAANPADAPRLQDFITLQIASQSKTMTLTIAADADP